MATEFYDLCLFTWSLLSQNAISIYLLRIECYIQNNMFSFRRYENESLVDNLLNVTDVEIAHLYYLLKVFESKIVGHEKVLIMDLHLKA